MYELVDRVRELAYFIWLQEGCPDGRAHVHWELALAWATDEVAYSLWEMAGRPLDDHSTKNQRWCSARGIVNDVMRIAQALAA
jgi:hypothetical protein